jgi:hypothetical protein
MRFRRFSLSLVLPLLVSAGARAEPSQLTPELRTELRANLDGSNDQLLAAAKRIQVLSAKERAEFGPALLHALERGVRDDVAPALLLLTAQTQGESARPTLALYLHHRTPSIRLAGAQALAVLRSKEAIEELSALAKSERDVNVRNAVFVALATDGGAEGERTLKEAWSHGDVDALVLLAGSCVNCREVVQAVGIASFLVLSKVARAVFARKGESAARVQGDMVRAIAALQSRDARELLRTLRTEFAASLSKPVLRALEESRP